MKLECLKEFKNLSRNILDSPEEWLQWSSSEYIETCNFPKSYQKKIVGFLKLILVSALRPDRLIEASEIYYLKLLKSSNKISVESLQNTVHSVTPLEPIVLDAPSVDPEFFMSNLQSSCYPLIELERNSVQISSLTSDRVGYLSQIISAAAKKGQWVAMKCVVCSNEEYRSVGTIMKEIGDKETHKRFRLWFLVSNNCLPSVKVIPKMQRINYSGVNTIRESVERFYKILGDNVLQIYSQSLHKHQLLSLTLFHISMTSRQMIENDAFMLTISDSEWIRAENLLRNSISSEDSESQSGLNLVNLILPIYFPSIATERSKNVLKFMAQSRLESDAVLNVSDHIPALTHYTVPTEHLLETHLTQLEFIYKATNDNLSFISPYLIVKKKVEENKLIQLAVSTLFNITIETSIDVPDVTQKMSELSNCLEKATVSCTDWFTILLSVERDNMVDILSRSLQILNDVASGLENMDTLTDFIYSKYKSRYSFDLDSKNINNQTTYINTILDNGQYLKNLMPSTDFPNNLTLKNFLNAEQFLMGFIKQHSPEVFDCQEGLMTLTYVPHSFRTYSGYSAQCLTMQDVFLLGAYWDAVGERIIMQAKPYLESLFQEISLPVVVAESKLGGKILSTSQVASGGSSRPGSGSSGRTVIIPMYRVDSLSTRPMCEVRLPSAVTQETCFEQSIRLVIG